MARRHSYATVHDDRRVVLAWWLRRKLLIIGRPFHFSQLIKYLSITLRQTLDGQVCTYVHIYVDMYE